MTYSEALTYLGEARRFGMKLGLEPMRQVARALGHPEEKLRFIHLAGTNGKGSTAAFCESCLRAAGFRVGLYTSPHLVSVRERIQVDRAPISEAAFAEGMAAVRQAIADTDDPPSTFFEIMTALALWHFAREGVDWVVWETGLGGRLDATNIVRPEICIITNIGLDHQQYLGQSLAEIAAEKAGIIKPGVPVISAVEKGEAGQVIEEVARAQVSPLIQVSIEEAGRDGGLRQGRQTAEIGGQRFLLGLIGSHQAENAACAVTALRQPPFRDVVPAEALARGLESTVWSGRFEILSESPLMVLDGAHNPAGMRKLVETWRAFLASRGFPEGADGKAHLVFASVMDKDVTEMVELLRPLAARVSLVRLENERSADPALLAMSFPDRPCGLYESLDDLWGELKTAPADVPILFTGSLFLTGEVLAKRGQGNGELRMNERLEATVVPR
jgi:dihydrofolate synthase/folylpolyglutamate synthase